MKMNIFLIIFYLFQPPYVGSGVPLPNQNIKRREQDKLGCVLYCVKCETTIVL